MRKLRLHTRYWTETPSNCRKLCLFIAYFVTSVFPTMTFSQDLNDVLREGTFADFRAVLNNDQWTEQSLSGALIAAAGLNLPAQALLLLEAGADPNYSIVWQNSVTVAANENSVGAMAVILDHGGDINFRSMFSWTPLHHAIQSDGSSYQAIELLISRGADIEARTTLGITPLHRAAGFCDIRTARLLVSAGADTMALEKYDRNAYQRAADAGCGEEMLFLR